jgi:hypothetical protein
MTTSKGENGPLQGRKEPSPESWVWSVPSTEPLCGSSIEHLISTDDGSSHQSGATGVEPDKTRLLNGAEVFGLLALSAVLSAVISFALLAFGFKIGIAVLGYCLGAPVVFIILLGFLFFKRRWQKI